MASSLADKAEQLSLLHLFSYLEENPKKSSSQARQVKGRILGLESVENESTETSVSCMVLQDGSKYQVHRINLEAYQSQEDTWTDMVT